MTFFHITNRKCKTLISLLTLLPALGPGLNGSGTGQAERRIPPHRQCYNVLRNNMKLLIVINLFCLSACFGQQHNLFEIAKRGNNIEVANFIRTYDRCFDSSWSFDSVKWQLIPTNRPGCLLFFHKINDRDKFERWYSFGVYGQELSGASESRYYGDGSKSFGRVYINSTGIFLIEQIFILPDSVRSDSKMREVVYEEYDGCQIICNSVFQGKAEDFKDFRTKEEFIRWKNALKPEVRFMKSTCL